METKKNCQNCGREFIAKKSNAKFCSASCRVSFFQKQKRIKEKTPIKKIQIWIKKNISKTAIWMIVILLFFYIVPPAFEKTIKIYEKYKLETDNKELQALRKKFEMIDNDYFEKIEKQNLKFKICLKAVLGEKNGWMSKEQIKGIKKISGIKKSDLE